MNKTDELLSQLFSLRNQYGEKITTRKLNLLTTLSNEKLKTKKAIQLWYENLLFLLAYPDNRSVYQLASLALEQLEGYIQSHENIKTRLFNSGITNTRLCAAFGFEIVKWLRKKYPNEVSLSSFEADEGTIQSILSAVMPKVESEILQDGNSDWKLWLKFKKGKDMLDKLIAIFDESDIRPEVKDELWSAIGINVEINFSSHLSLPPSLITPYYHHSLVRKKSVLKSNDIKATKVVLTEGQAERVIECGRMILVRHLREIDPISFTAVPLITYYRLPRGLSIALMGMIPERRHPIDSYMGYVVFKNGLPVAYAGSWILFDSGRIGLNIFPAYRGGESQYIFQQVLKLHGTVYHLNRFTVDPYQIGKDNSDGIKSGAFWTYYHAGFRPIRQQQKQISETEASKIKSTKGYRTPTAILEKLADSRMEIVLKKTAVTFDATDISLVYARILKEQWNNDRKLAEGVLFTKLVKLLQIKNYQEEKLKFILKNWCVLLLSREEKLRRNKKLNTMLKDLFEIKARGAEEDYISGLQRNPELKRLLEEIVKENI
ncbi:MAG: hypothetical protein E6H06_06530 [Bacteroidetes bacterium]|nr:MAG: hypothetical protein E6H06_06530 [Bacteroidota bacterium]